MSSVDIGEKSGERYLFSTQSFSQHPAGLLLPGFFSCVSAIFFLLTFFTSTADSAVEDVQGKPVKEDVKGGPAGFAEFLGESKRIEAAAGEKFACGDWAEARTAYIDWMLHDLKAAASLTPEAARSNVSPTPEAGIFLGSAAAALAEERFLGINEYSVDVVVLKGLERAFNYEEVFPVTVALVRRRHLEIAVRTGNIKAAAADRAALGLIPAWLVAAPFDNENGTGFDRKFLMELDAASPPIADAAAGESFGKPVHWREIRDTSPYGYLELGDIVEPREYVVAYAAVYLNNSTGAPVDAVLRLATDDGLKVFLDGREIYANNVTRPATFDQDAVALRIAPGCNYLLIKVTQLTGDFRLLARLTGPRGELLQGLKTSLLSPADAALHSPDAAGSHVRHVGDNENSVEPAPFRGSPTDMLYYLDGKGSWRAAWRHAAGVPEDYAPRAMFHTALVSLDTAAHSVLDAPERDLLRQALRERPGDVPLLFALARASETWRATDAERDYNAAVTAYREVLDKDPDNVPALFFLASCYFRRCLNIGEAEVILKRLEGLAVGDKNLPAAVLLEAEIDWRRGRKDEALLALERCRGAGNDKKERAVYPPAERFRALVGEMPSESAAAAVEALSADKGNPDAYVLAAREKFPMLGGIGDSCYILREASKLFRYNPKILLESYRCETAADNISEALAVCDRASLALPGDTAWRMRRAAALRQAGKEPEALEVIRATASSTGTVSESSENERENKDLYTIGTDSGVLPPPDSPTGAVLLFRENISLFEPDGTGMTRITEKVAVTSQRGVKRFRRREINCDFSGERVVVEAARIIRRGGEVVKVSPKGPYRFDEIGRSWRKTIVDFRSLRPGDVTVLKYTLTRYSPGPMGVYFDTVFPFTGEDPVNLARFVLVHPKGMKISIATPLFRGKRSSADPGDYGITDNKNYVAEVFENRGGKADIPEPGSANPIYRRPRVEVSSHGRWDALGRFYWGLVRSQLTFTPVMRRKLAGELPLQTAADEKKRDALERILRFVTRSIRYQQWHFGVHGYKPYSVESILDKRFGDCKDKVSLAISLLNEAGIKARPLLLYSTAPGEVRGEEPHPLARLSLFNHVILYLPDQSGLPGPRFIDPTSDRDSPDQLPYADQGAVGYVVGADGGFQVTVPRDGPKRCRVNIIEKITVNPDGRAYIALKSVSEGHFAFLDRIFLRNERYADYNIGRLFGKQGRRVRVVSGSEDLPREHNGPEGRIFRFSATLVARGFFRKTGDSASKADNASDGKTSVAELRLLYPYFRGFDARYDMFPDSFTRRFTPVSKRKQPLYIQAPWGFSRRATIKLSPGWELAGGKLLRHAEVPEARWRLSVSQAEAGNLLIEETLEILAHAIEPQRYRDFRRFCVTLDRLMNAPVLLVTRKELPSDTSVGEKRPAGDGGR